MPATAARSPRLVIDEDRSDCLQVRRKMKIWWPGLLVPLGLALWAAGVFDPALASLREEVLTGPARLVIAPPLGLIFLGLFAFISDAQRLTASAGRLDYLWHFGPIPFRHCQAALAAVQSIICDGDEGIYFLRIKTTDWEASFGAGHAPEAAFQELQGKLGRLVDAARRESGLPPQLPTEPPPGAVAVRRRRDRKPR